MGKLFEIGTAAEYFKHEILLCERRVMSHEFDLAESKKCFNRCNGGTERFWGVCVAMDEKALSRQKERLTMLKARFRECR